MTEEVSQTPPATTETTKTPPPQSARPIAHAFAQNLHAVLIGSFTILSSVISALLGYYFGHEDQKRLLVLEYDKLRAEHTLEITKSLVTAESVLQNLLVIGSDSSKRYCKLAQDLATLKTDVGKVAKLPVGGTLNQILAGLDPLIQTAAVSEDVRQNMLTRLRAMQSEHDDLDKRIQGSWKKDEDIRTMLNGDTAAMIRVYYRDRSFEFADLSTGYDKVAIATREIILDNGLCNLEPRWKEAEAAMLKWGTESFQFTGSLGLELRPD